MKNLFKELSQIIKVISKKSEPEFGKLKFFNHK
jgi:hypothetical protein